MSFVLTVVVAVVIIAVVKWLWDRYTIQQIWQRLGIPGPKSKSLILGNLGDVLAKGTFPIYEEWTKEYGKVFGYYQSCVPVLVVSDLDMAREILVKQFDKFGLRMLFTDNTNFPINNLLDQGVEQWKKVRSLSSPTFTARRMKELSPLVHKSIDKLMERFKERSDKGDAFNIYEDIKCMTIDAIASTAFSYESDVFTGKGNTFVKKLAIVLRSTSAKHATVFDTIQILIAFVFPGLVYFGRLFNPYFIAPQMTWFTDLAKKTIEDRLRTGEYRSDYLQLMLKYGNKQVISGGTSGAADSDDDNDDASDLRQGAQRKELTMAEMQGQIFLFLVAGYDTTATVMSVMCHYLAVYPEVQTKLKQEIDEHFTDASKPVNYETAQNLVYLEMVFYEAARLSSVAQFALCRQCSEDVVVGGYHIPKGAKVVVNSIDIHSNQEQWGPEPVDQFVPERFTKERKGARHPMAYLPFGEGPRHCIGMRFAILEIKMAVINMLRRYTIVKCEETKVPLPLNQDGLRVPSDGVHVKLVERE